MTTLMVMFILSPVFGMLANKLIKLLVYRSYLKKVESGMFTEEQIVRKFAREFMLKMNLAIYKSKNSFTDNLRLQMSFKSFASSLDQCRTFEQLKAVLNDPVAMKAISELEKAYIKSIVKIKK